MNKINVLYQNLNFKSGGYSIDENLEQPIFASDVTLTDLLKKASIANYDSYKKIENLKDDSSTKVEKNFQKHPRYITDDSMVSLDGPTEAQKSKIEAIIRKVTFKHHVNMETSDASSFTNCLPAMINKVDLPEINLQDIQNLEQTNENNKKIINMEVQEDILGVKFKSYLIKILAWMQEIRTTIQAGLDTVEGSEDYYRRQRRAAEFSSRFSRNYLYQLGRQLVELRRHTTQKTLSARPGTPSPGRCLTNACQTVLQAVQAYCNHIPNTISIPGSDSGNIHAKFCELLKNTCNFFRVVRKMSCNYYDVASSLPLIEDIERNSKSLMNLVQETLMKRVEIEPKPIIKSKKNSASLRSKKESDQSYNKHHLESRLSMYSVAFKKNSKTNPNWKKNAEKLAKQRFNVQSRYKNPKQMPLAPDNSPVRAEKTILFDKKKSIAVKKVSSDSANDLLISNVAMKINEDDIPTMVQMENKNTEIVTPGSFRSRLEPILKTLVAEVAAGKEDDFLGHGICEDMLLKLRDLLDQVHRPVPNLSPVKFEKKSPAIENRITITGPKNAKLICIKDKSLFESKTEVKTLNPKFHEPFQPKSLSLLPELERNASRKKVAKYQSMANLSKQYTINIIQYKIEFHKYTKPLMMYRKTAQVLPWILTGKITNSLFDHLLLSVINETNIDEVAQKMYRAEFETFC